MHKRDNGIYATDLRRRGTRLAVSLRTRTRKLARERECILIDLLAREQTDIIDRIRNRTLTWEEVDRAFGPRGGREDDLRPSATITLDAACAATILAAENGNRPRTVDSYHVTCRAIRTAFGSDTPVREVTRTRITQWLYARPWAYNTKNNFTLQAGRVWKVASQLAIDIGEAPIDNIWHRIPLTKPAATEKEFLDVAATHMLLTAISDRSVPHAAWLACGYLAGLRIGEATHLRWEDIDFEQREIHIRAHTRPRVWRPKTIRSIGRISAPSRLIALLSETPNRHSYVFGSFRKNTAIRFTEEAYRFGGIGYGRRDEKARAADEEISLTYHHGRHSMISNALRAGMPVAMVAAQARASVPVILQTYAHLLPQDRADVAAVFDAPVGALRVVK